MGSVDRIANGLGKMAKVVFGRPEEGLRRMPEIMLEKLMSSLRESQFTNILRRSAGAPYAFSCLLRSEGLGKKLLIEKTIKTLLTMAKENMRNDKVNSVE